MAKEKKMLDALETGGRSDAEEEKRRAELEAKRIHEKRKTQHFARLAASNGGGSPRDAMFRSGAARGRRRARGRASSSNDDANYDEGFVAEKDDHATFFEEEGEDHADAAAAPPPPAAEPPASPAEPAVEPPAAPPAEPADAPPPAPAAAHAKEAATRDAAAPTPTAGRGRAAAAAAAAARRGAARASGKVSSRQSNDFIDDDDIGGPDGDAPERARAATHEHTTKHADGGHVRNSQPAAKKSSTFLRGLRKQVAAATGMHHTFSAKKAAWCPAALGAARQPVSQQPSGSPAVSMRRASAAVLGVLVADARAAWLTRWAEVDGDCVDGWRRLDVACVEDDVVVDEGLCESEDRPDAFAACSARIVHVDAAAGDDANDGSAASPLATLGACIDKFGVDHSATKWLPEETAEQLVCSLRGGTYDREAGARLDGADHVLVAPASADDVVVFDGTDAVGGVAWVAHASHPGVVVADVAVARRGELLVGGSGLQCANESAVSDGGHAPKLGYGTASAPCFLWEPDEAWVAGGAAFAMDDAVAYYEAGDAAVNASVPWFWVDERRGRVYVDEARGPPDAKTLRRKNATRGDVVVVGDASHRVFVRDAHFYGTGCCGAGPSTKSLVSQDLRVSGSRFLYAPPTGVRLRTTAQSKRGGTPFAAFLNNTVEFSEAALFYKGTGCRVVGNYLAFNSFEARGAYTLDNMAQRSVVAFNTLLYNGDKGGHFSWARGHFVFRNLVVGQDFLGPRFDAAVFHAVTTAQRGLVVEENWVLGPSLVSFARLDTSKTTTPAGAGSDTTIRRNVHLGLGLTLKGYNHTVEHNTGSRLLVVEAWAEIDDHNYASLIRYNAHSATASRGSTAAHGAIPGLSYLNACGDDLRVCNPRNDSAPPELARQLRPLRDGVQAELVEGAWPAVDTSGVGEGGNFNEAGVADGAELLGSLPPHAVGTPLAEGLDFRPSPSGRLALACDACGGDAAYDDHLGAYAVDDDLWVPGCYACVPEEPEPTAEPTEQVDGDCMDSTSWFYKKKSKKDCAWVAEKGKRCKSKVADDDGVSSLDACPVTCGSGCACADSTSWFYKKSKKDCAWVAKKTRRCKSKVADDADISSKEACPVACGRCD
ncbi:hypothetical protein JL722_12135 [Aureococcus anophagefferens]|nr:hypothetical protein JL722_12135 [Aureococcus anophagefferens]